jgi:hypothetical protein
MNKKFIYLALLVSFTVPTMINPVSKNTSGGRSSASSYTPQPSPQDDMPSTNINDTTQSTAIINKQNKKVKDALIGLGITGAAATTFLASTSKSTATKMGYIIDEDEGGRIVTLPDNANAASKAYAKIYNETQSIKQGIKNKFISSKEDLQGFINSRNNSYDKSIGEHTYLTIRDNKNFESGDQSTLISKNTGKKYEKLINQKRKFVHGREFKEK